MAEGIAGGPPSRHNISEGIFRSILQELCEDGQQMVQLTKLYRKNTELLFPEDNASSKYLEDYVCPPAPSTVYVRWSTRYLSEKLDD